MIKSILPWSKKPHRPMRLFDWNMTPMMERFFGPEEEWWPLSERFMPRVDIVETDKTFEVKVDLPGLKPEDIHVDIHGKELWITGEKKEVHEEEEKTFHRVERHYGQFRRILPLPGDVNEEQVEASFEDGVLNVSIAKVEEAQTKHIEIKS